ncbi:MAG TPA: hypothetical protein P5277_04965 [Candidatus Paceibacterota bacterium]|nr:hypothetical protein [Candidatus Paceibacterota bacterium]
MNKYQNNLRIENEREPIEYKEIKLPTEFSEKVRNISEDEKIMEYLRLEEIIQSIKEQNDFF